MQLARRGLLSCLLLTTMSRTAVHGWEKVREDFFWELEVFARFTIRVVHNLIMNGQRMEIKHNKHPYVFKSSLDAYYATTATCPENEFSSLFSGILNITKTRMLW